MTGTQVAYFLFVRWKHGTKDYFEITREAALHIARTPMYKCRIDVQTPMGFPVFIDFVEACAYKVIVRKVGESPERYNPQNPLEHPSVYDDCLN